MDAQATYDQALAEFRVIFAAFSKTRDDYRARKIGDAEFLAARKRLDVASARVDAAETALKG